MCVLDFAQDYLNRGAQKKAARAQQGIMNELTGVSRAEFDNRMNLARESDGRTGSILDRQRADMTGLEDRTFADLLAQTQGGFDDQLGLNRSTFDRINAAETGLITATRQSRLDQLAASNAERDRQRAFQDQADGLAEALPGQVGFDAQQGMAADGMARRLALASGLINADTTSLPAMVKGLNPELAAFFGQKANEGKAVATTDAASAARVGGIGDGFTGAERNLGSFADALSSLTTRAQISRGALDSELGVGALQGRQAGDRANAAADMAGREYDQRSRTEGTYRDSMTGAIRSNSSNLGSALADYFGSSLGTEGNFTGNMVGSSQNYENTRIGLGNYKMGKTTGYSPLGNAIGIFQSAAERAAAAMKGG